MKKLLLCRNCELKNDCTEYCDDALNFKPMTDNKKPVSNSYLEDKLINGIIDFADNAGSDPSMSIQSKVHKIKRNKKALQN